MLINPIEFEHKKERIRKQKYYIDHKAVILLNQEKRRENKRNAELKLLKQDLYKKFSEIFFSDIDSQDGLKKIVDVAIQTLKPIKTLSKQM